MADLPPDKTYAYLKILNAEGEMVGMEKHEMFLTDAHQAVSNWPLVWSLEEWPHPASTRTFDPPAAPAT